MTFVVVLFRIGTVVNKVFHCPKIRTGMFQAELRSNRKNKNSDFIFSEIRREINLQTTKYM